jgi:tRNA threonylcarbamoyl adenosine modification protein YeaZ
MLPAPPTEIIMASVLGPLTLALEQSSAVQDAALVRGAHVLARRSWRAESVRSQRLFAAVPELLAEAGVTLGDVELFAVGTGPGSFSGIRATIAAARAMALPGGRPVLGVSSAEALATRLAQEHRSARRIVVFGDARRQRVWIGEFDAGDGAVTGNPEPRLAPVAELAEVLRRGGVLGASPDLDRLHGVLAEFGLPPGAVLPDLVCSDAVTVAGLAASRHVPETLPVPPVPIYLHPPVFAQPA